MSGQYPVNAAIWLVPGVGIICSIWEQNSFKLQCWHEQSGWAVFIVKNWVRSATNQGARFLRIPGQETIKHIVIVWSWSFGVQNECQEIQNHVMLSYPCPLKTSCDSSTTFQTLRLLSRPPDVAARSRLRLSIAVTLSWWPNLQMKKIHKDPIHWQEKITWEKACQWSISEMWLSFITFGQENLLFSD